MTYFIANAEDFTILLDHSVQVCVGAFIRSPSLKHLTHIHKYDRTLLRPPPPPPLLPPPTCIDVHRCVL
jgi:hypothetical protein